MRDKNRLRWYLLVIGFVGILLTQQYVHAQSVVNWGVGYVTSWIQVQGGNAYAQNTLGLVNIPTPSPSSGGYFALGEQNLDNHPGIVSCGGTCSGFGGGLVSKTGWRVQGDPVTSRAYDFTFYKDRLKPNCPTTTTTTIPATEIATSGLHCYLAPTTGAGANISSAVSASGATYSIVMVDGNLTVDKTVSIANGGFILFVASGNIIFDPAIGSLPANNIPTVAGVYIASNQLIVRSLGADPQNEKQFVGRGAFVGYKGVDLQRNLGAGNANYPAERFVYDATLLRAAFPVSSGPSALMTKLDWRELPP